VNVTARAQACKKQRGQRTEGAPKESASAKQVGALPPATSLLNREMAGSLNGAGLTASEDEQPLQSGPLVLSQRRAA